MTASIPPSITPSGPAVPARPGALSAAQMEDILIRAPEYRVPHDAPARVHADTALRLWGGRLRPLMAGPRSTGRFAGAALDCPSTACTGTLDMDGGARSKAWRNAHAIENLLCIEGQLELRYGARLEHALTLGRYDMVSVPAGVRHALANPGDTEARALVALSIAPDGSYDAVFDLAESEGAGGSTLGAPNAFAALGVRFDDDHGTAVDADAVASRVNRFATLVPYKKLNRAEGLSSEATEALTAGSIYTLIVPEGHIGRGPAPIRGHQGFYMSIGECRTPDDGPPPHAHEDTQESFFVLDGTWNIHTGFDRESTVRVGPGDLIAMPKGVMRTFSNTSGHTARLVAIIQGPDQMRDAVSFSRRLGTEFEQRFGAEAVEAFRHRLMTFDAEDRLGA